MNDMQGYDLKELMDMDIDSIDPDMLVDIKEVKVNTELPQPERQREFIRQIKNPYCYKCGKTIVKISFSETDATFYDRMKSLLE